MSYVICNSKKQYFTDHTGSLTTDINRACKWKEISKANNVLKIFNGCKKNNRYHNQFNVVHVINENHEVIPPVTNPIELSYDIKEEIQHLQEFINNLEQRRIYLIQEISKCDLEQNDLLHAAEFYVLNAYQGYKLYKMIHDLRIRRRRYKDELLQITATLNTTLSSDKLKKVESCIEGLETRQYCPRIHKELFG